MLTKKQADSLVGLVAVLAATAFLLIGFLTNAWHVAWLVFLLIPVTAILSGLLSGDKDIGGLITGMVAILATIAYMIMGFVFNLWHPGWLVFMIIPITAIIAGMFTDDKKPDNKPDEQDPGQD